MHSKVEEQAVICFQSISLNEQERNICDALEQERNILSRSATSAMHRGAVGDWAGCSALLLLECNSSAGCAALLADG